MMDKEVLECVLERNCKDSRSEKILSLETVPAVGKFLNYLSTVNRINLKIILGNGRTVKWSVIIKVMPTNELLAEFNNKLNTFRNEVIMYGVLKEFEYLMEEFEDSDDVLWCQMIYQIPYTCIVMEDLKGKGFHMVGKEDLFDLEHSMFAIHALGRFHAMSKTMEEKGLLSPKEFRSWYFFDRELINPVYWSMVSLLEGIKKLWGPSWTPVVDKIKITKESCSKKLSELSVLDETKFNLLNHGDCHKSNIVFKYGWDERLIGIRFVDFQMVNYGSPCLDLTYLVYLALQPTVRRENLDLLLKTYHDSLSNTLDKYQYKGNKPSLDEIKEGMEKYCFVGYFLFLTRYPGVFMTEDLEKKQDMAKVFATDGKEGYPDELFNPDILEEAMGPDLKTFSELFF